MKSLQLPNNVSRVDVCRYSGSGELQLKALRTGRVATSLAAAMNALPSTPPGSYACGLDDGAFDRVVFYTESRAIDLIARLSGCTFITGRNGSVVASRAVLEHLADLVGTPQG